MGVAFASVTCFMVVGWLLWGYFSDWRLWWRLRSRDALRAEIREEVLQGLKISMYFEAEGSIRQMVHCDAGYALELAAFDGSQLFDRDVNLGGRLCIMVREE